MTPMCSAGVLASVPKCKKAVLALPEKICVFDKLHSGMNYSAAGCELNVSESTMCIK